MAKTASDYDLSDVQPIAPQPATLDDLPTRGGFAGRDLAPEKKVMVASFQASIDQLAALGKESALAFNFIGDVFTFTGASKDKMKNKVRRSVRDALDKCEFPEGLTPKSFGMSFQFHLSKDEESGALVMSGVTVYLTRR